uniref:Uncharacterized protein n=1 Tax=Dicentrarchus labrax TaxID=13489 RepID=A0A8C4FA36_DICLA
MFCVANFIHQSFFAILVEQFVGTWKLTASKTSDVAMKAFGEGFTQQMGNMSTFNTTESKFKLQDEFEKVTYNQITKTMITLENGNFVQKQTLDGKTTTQTTPYKKT